MRHCKHTPLPRNLSFRPRPQVPRIIQLLVAAVANDLCTFKSYAVYIFVMIRAGGLKQVTCLWIVQTRIG